MSFPHVPISARCKALWLGNLGSGRDLPNKASLEKSNGSGNQHLLCILYKNRSKNTRFFPCPICVHSRLRRNFQARWASWTTFWKKKPNLPVQDSRKCELTASGRLPHFHHDLLAFIDIECKVSPPQDFLCHWMSNLSGFFGGNLNRTCQSSCLGWVTPSRNYTAYGTRGLL